MRKITVISLVSLILSILLVACGPTASPGDTGAASTPVAAQADTTKKLADDVRAFCNSLPNGCVEPQILHDRIIRENTPGFVQFVYLVSSMTGHIIMKATAVGKVASTTKRLDSPQEYVLSDLHDCGEYSCTSWLLYDRVGPDGAFGSSTTGYVWFDTSGQMIEIKSDNALLIMLERPYLFPEDKINLQLDIRLQSDALDTGLEIQMQKVSEWVKVHPEWKPGLPIPIDVITGSQSAPSVSPTPSVNTTATPTP